MQFIIAGYNATKGNDLKSNGYRQKLLRFFDKILLIIDFEIKLSKYLNLCKQKIKLIFDFLFSA